MVLGLIHQGSPSVGAVAYMAVARVIMSLEVESDRDRFQRAAAESLARRPACGAGNAFRVTGELLKDPLVRRPN